ncbi:helix-turn-helix transcriptional regulator [Vibrio parahaemolyticus]
MHQTPVFEDRLIREKERCLITQISRTQAWRLEKQGKFPRRITHGRSVFWRFSDIMDWLQSREAA